MSSINTRFIKVRSQIRHAEIASGTPPGDVKLLAVSKTKPVENIITLYQLGQRHFGESYLQEALAKQRQLGAFNITWHFIGPIQSNKTKALASHFSWVHSVDRLKIATRLNEQRPQDQPPLNICLQVNISEEQSKSGVSLNELPNLIEQVEQLPKLRLRGVMAIPSPQTDYELQRKPYHLLNQVVTQLENSNLTIFSYGMSGDLRAAIAEGATIVRIGTALFGKRNLS
jgi:pyridoxal phosphate enzyme (YggS family)